MTEQQQPAAQPEKKLLWTATQVAEFFHVSKSYVYDLVKAGSIPYGKIGRLIRFDPDDIQAWWRIRKHRRR